MRLGINHIGEQQMLRRGLSYVQSRLCLRCSYTQSKDIAEDSNYKFTSSLPEHVGIIQFMPSFEVNIRICQPNNSDVHRGEAEVNITFEG